MFYKKQMKMKRRKVEKTGETIGNGLKFLWFWGQILNIVLKCTEVIKVSWLVVFWPTYVILSLIFLLLIIYIFLSMLNS